MLFCEEATKVFEKYSHNSLLVIGKVKIIASFFFTCFTLRPWKTLVQKSVIHSSIGNTLDFGLRGTGFKSQWGAKFFCDYDEDVCQSSEMRCIEHNCF